MLSCKATASSNTHITQDSFKECVRAIDGLTNVDFTIDTDSYLQAREVNSYHAKILLHLAGYEFDYSERLETILYRLATK